MKRPPRTVLDTNLVLSALIFREGRLTALREVWQRGRVVPLVSKVTVAELIRVLAYPKFRLSAEEREELLADYLPHCTAVRIPQPPPKTPACRDPFDRPFLELAAAGKADYLVTGDRDLLGLAGRFVCPVVTAQELLSLLGRPEGK